MDATGINVYLAYSAAVGICLGIDSVLDDMMINRAMPKDNSLGLGRAADMITRGLFMTIVGAVLSPVVTAACLADYVAGRMNK